MAQQVARDLGIGGLVDAVGAQEEVVPLLSIADLFLLPSAQESFGLAALEAMACEVPVVASRVGGLPEVIEHGVSGFLHPLDAIDEMAASGIALLTDESLHRDVAQADVRSVLSGAVVLVRALHVGVARRENRLHERVRYVFRNGLVTRPLCQRDCLLVGLEVGHARRTHR